MGYDRDVPRDGRVLGSVFPVLRDELVIPASFHARVPAHEFFSRVDDRYCMESGFQLLRSQMGLSVSMCSLALGVHKRQVTFWESGQRRMPAYVFEWLRSEYVKWSDIYRVLSFVCSRYVDEVFLPQPLKNINGASSAEYVSPLLSALVSSVLMNLERDEKMSHSLRVWRVGAQEVLEWVGRFVPEISQKWADTLRWRMLDKPVSGAEKKDKLFGVPNASHHRGKYVSVDVRRQGVHGYFDSL